MSDIIDRKFKILAVNPCNGKIYTEKDGIFLCAKDRGLVRALREYHEACIDMGCDDSHIESVSLLRERVAVFQKTESRVPDTEGDCEIDRCIGGILK